MAAKKKAARKASVGSRLLDSMRELREHIITGRPVTQRVVHKSGLRLTTEAPILPRTRKGAKR